MTEIDRNVLKEVEDNRKDEVVVKRDEENCTPSALPITEGSHAEIVTSTTEDVPRGLTCC